MRVMNLIKSNKILKILIILTLFNLNLFSQFSEYEIKVAMIGKFTFFIDWPEDYIKNSENFIINIIGAEKYVLPFKEIFKNKKIKNLPVNIIYTKGINDVISDSHIIIINKRIKNKLNKILNIVKNKPILIISDNESLAKLGAHISFFIKNNKIKFKINYESLKNTTLKMSYMLLNYGEIINK